MSLIHVKNLTFTYDGSYEPVFENASFQIDTGWRLGLIGRNGRCFACWAGHIPIRERSPRARRFPISLI